MFQFISDAMAQEGGSSMTESPFFSMVPFIIIFVVFYFLLIRPQQKKQKAHQNMLNELKKGDQIVTNGGIHGTVYKLGDSVITIEIADKVKIQLDRPQIARIIDSSSHSN
ncbi:MAG: preprotein translocase subunit YajC [SAR324 cluster bacterium]|nr:preprotein translocase subunit YajC [SAR324 cluster bacterium]